ncbi:hypothetical protein SBA2_100018 [Acidobacteriia bacterium SbA2]|nr:hypothetical protein SBA2_100018 [Acidobacteriia bacterium SbA2]
MPFDLWHLKSLSRLSNGCPSFASCYCPSADLPICRSADLPICRSADLPTCPLPSSS